MGTVVDPPVRVGAVHEGGLVPPTRHLVQPDAAHAVPKLRIGPHTRVLSRRKRYFKHPQEINSFFIMNEITIFVVLVLFKKIANVLMMDN